MNRRRFLDAPTILLSAKPIDPSHPQSEIRDSSNDGTRALKWFDAPWIDGDRVRTRILSLHQYDWLGRPFAIGLMVLWCLALAGPTSLVEIGGLPIAIVWLLRFARFADARRITWALLIQPITIVFLVWAAWCVLLIVRLPEQREAWHELGASRWAWCLLALPFVGFARSRWVLLVAVGFLCANFGQLLEAIGHRLELPSLQFKHYSDRISAWLDPVTGGTCLVAAFGLLLPTAMMGRGQARLLASLASVASFAGIIATGSRGAWLAATALAMIVAATTAWKLRGRVRARHAVVTFACVAIGLCAIGVLGREVIVPRVRHATNDVSRAWNGDYATDTGLRLFIARQAVELAAEHPILGVGPGQFRAAAIARIDDHNAEMKELIPAHAHNTILHLTATTGFPGVLLWLAMFCLGMRNAWVHASRGGWGTLAAGPFFGLLGLAVVSGTDVVQLNQQTGAVLFMLLGLSPSAPFVFERGGVAAASEVPAARGTSA